MVKRCAFVDGLLKIGVKIEGKLIKIQTNMIYGNTIYIQLSSSRPTRSTYAFTKDEY
jgi:hypothetical protein